MRAVYFRRQAPKMIIAIQERSRVLIRSSAEKACWTRSSRRLSPDFAQGFVAVGQFLNLCGGLLTWETLQMWSQAEVNT